jgi:hypothetical protein
MLDPSLRVVSSAVIPETLANCLPMTDAAHSQIIAEGDAVPVAAMEVSSAEKMKIRIP